MMATGNGLGDLMQQAERMKAKLQEIQAEIGRLEVVGESGAGLVKVRMTGQHDVRKVDIDPGLLGEAREVLEDLLAAAMNDAIRRAERSRQEKMAELTAGIPLPPGFSFPFS